MENPPRVEGLGGIAYQPQPLIPAEAPVEDNDAAEAPKDAKAPKDEGKK